jgi:hypothetical protein
MKPSLKDEEWQFIEAGHYTCSDDEKPVLLRYELAREAFQCRIKSNSPDRTLFESIFPTYFPDTPYLAIPAEERARLWRDAFDPRKSGGLQRFDPGQPGTGFFYQYHYLPPEGVELSSPEQLAALQDSDCDQSCAVVSLTLNFDYPDKQLIDAFTEMLRQIRRTDPVFEKRGQASVDTMLKQLAASRLARHLGSETDVEAFLGRRNFELPYEGASGWSKAKSQIAQLLDGYFYVSGQSVRPAHKS